MRKSCTPCDWPHTGTVQSRPSARGSLGKSDTCSPRQQKWSRTGQAAAAWAGPQPPRSNKAAGSEAGSVPARWVRFQACAAGLRAELAECQNWKPVGLTMLRGRQAKLWCFGMCDMMLFHKPRQSVATYRCAPHRIFSNRSAYEQWTTQKRHRG